MFVNQNSKKKKVLEKLSQIGFHLRNVKSKISERKFSREQKMAKVLFVTTSNLNLLWHMLMFAAYSAFICFVLCVLSSYDQHSEKVLRNHPKSCKQFIMTENTSRIKASTKRLFTFCNIIHGYGILCTISLSSHIPAMWHYVWRNWICRNRMFQCQKIRQRWEKHGSQSKNVPISWKCFYYANDDISPNCCHTKTQIE